jgi:hypothetical protein
MFNIKNHFNLDFGSINFIVYSNSKSSHMIMVYQFSYFIYFFLLSKSPKTRFTALHRCWPEIQWRTRLSSEPVDREVFQLPCGEGNDS